MKAGAARLINRLMSNLKTNNIPNKNVDLEDKFDDVSGFA